jgi:hypothetical protein
MPEFRKRKGWCGNKFESAVLQGFGEIRSPELSDKNSIDTQYHCILSSHLPFRALHSSRLAGPPDPISADRTSKKIEE